MIEIIKTLKSPEMCTCKPTGRCVLLKQQLHFQTKIIWIDSQRIKLKRERYKPFKVYIKHIKHVHILYSSPLFLGFLCTVLQSKISSSSPSMYYFHIKTSWYIVHTLSFYDDDESTFLCFCKGMHIINPNKEMNEWWTRLFLLLTQVRITRENTVNHIDDCDYNDFIVKSIT